MSTSLSAAAAAIPATSGSHLGVNRNANSNSSVLLQSNAQFREIHKNTWLKRLTADGKKITVGPKKSERSWVVFCVHDDMEALLEGYAEPRQAVSHVPEWIVSLQDTLHISHALIPNSQEFEFVVTLSNEVLHFHATSWETMQEWVEILRSKLREMKILSPRENLYTKLPEVRAPLLPTRDPTSPLPAPPPVPAAIVPGIEHITAHQRDENEAIRTTAATTAILTATTTTTVNSINNIPSTAAMTASTQTASISTVPQLNSMSNTLTQNLLNMLSDPISTYSEQINDSEPYSVDIAEDLNSHNNEQLSNSEQDLNLSNDEFLSPLLRKACVVRESGIRVDIGVEHRASADQIMSLEHLLQCERLIPRPQTSRSMSAGAADKTKKPCKSNILNNSKITTARISSNLQSNDIGTNTSSASDIESSVTTSTANNESNTNITIIQVSTNSNVSNVQNNDRLSDNEEHPPKLPIKTITAEIFKFPEIPKSTKIVKQQQQHEYKSNVQIIPSNLNSSTIQVLGQETSLAGNQYSTPLKIDPNTANNTTMVRVVNNEKFSLPTAMATATSVAVYGTCYTPTTTTTAPTTTVVGTNVGTSTINQQTPQLTPKLSKKIILTASTYSITNIIVNNTESVTDSKIDEVSISDVKQNAGNIHYEKIFLSSSIPVANNIVDNEIINNGSEVLAMQNSRNTDGQWQSLCPQLSSTVALSTEEQEQPHILNVSNIIKKPQTTQQTFAQKPSVSSEKNSPVLTRQRLVSPSATTVSGAAQQPMSLARPPILTRGLTEAVITTRPSRRDFHYMKLMNTHVRSKTNRICTNNSGAMSNNNIENVVASTSSNGMNNSVTPVHAALSRTNAESMEHRRRSSSTPDAHIPLQRFAQRGTNNNEFPGTRNNALRMQHPSQPLRNSEYVGIASNVIPTTTHGSSPVTAAATAAKRLTLREQQVMQLRREIMHPGGVRLQLRRKDCVGSIAWVDAFGAVWVAGWKQKDHPVLYNALHIGDQLLSIAGVTISNATEANKIIRNTNTLFVEVLVRRIPFGRAYAIRRDREGQCLGLIRDGNTATIVDVVPNSLAARHGLPPKTQSSDGTTLTFWILTEINGRPLNLFFKDHEIRDRLNSVGRDISILVQPADLITKLKKQLKSMRSYKDYLVQ